MSALKNRDILGETQAAKLWSALERYAAMQEEHLALLRGGRLQGVLRWQAERQRSFALLRSLLNELGDLGDLGDRELAERLGERLGAVIATENRLAKVVRESRERVNSQLASLRKGRKAMGRLGGRAENVSRPPRFVSSLA